MQQTETATARTTTTAATARDFTRVERIIPRERIAGLKADIIGVGAIGRQLALQLAAIGCPHLRLFDFDTVEPTNVTTQVWPEKHLGRPKVEAAWEDLLEIDPQLAVEPVADRWRPKYGSSEVVFACVDSIGARAAIWRSVKHSVRFWCDGRMLSEVMRILGVADGEGADLYEQSLFRQELAQTGETPGCTRQVTSYTAAIAAGLMLHQFTRWLRGMPVDADLSLNLLASELTVR